eukprot:CAMPEP_0118978268 /NCGR_PEP_ID=MMETSP1173-20130426/23282_1 /TAXON_ID=1034831 /ORGANISM="Rhizochromulina marina cf, Strain CCMP1243" /LENGTH=34 /DNA_ID= /DNA_START= /DNA_END= /DNA_ORIENTATION=
MNVNSMMGMSNMGMSSVTKLGSSTLPTSTAREYR